MASTPPVVDIEFFGKGLPINTYAYNAQQWANNNLIPKVAVPCPCLRRDVYLSKKKLKHTIAHKRYSQQENYDHETLSVLSVLVEALEIAEVRYSIDDNKGRENIVKIHKLKSTVNVAGTNRHIEIIIQEIFVEEFDENRLYFYNHTFI